MVVSAVLGPGASAGNAAGGSPQVIKGMTPLMKAA